MWEFRTHPNKKKFALVLPQNTNIPFVGQFDTETLMWIGYNVFFERLEKVSYLECYWSPLPYHEYFNSELHEYLK